MSISVVIPALDEAERIERTLEAARQPGAELLVVDGGSRDETVARARRAGATVLHSAPGRARQLEAGARAAEGDVLLFLHADTLLPAGWARAVAQALADPDVAGGAFAFAFDERGPGLRVVELGARLRCRWLGLPYGDQGLFLRRKLLREIGGVPQAPILEDLDLVHAIRARGRLALLDLPAITSARRYREAGCLRTMLRNWLALAGYGLGVDRARLASWTGR